jgi:hypothetical protein
MKLTHIFPNLLRISFMGKDVIFKWILHEWGPCALLKRNEQGLHMTFYKYSNVFTCSRRVLWQLLFPK